MAGAAPPAPSTEVAEPVLLDDDDLDDLEEEPTIALQPQHIPWPIPSQVQSPPAGTAASGGQPAAVPVTSAKAEAETKLSSDGDGDDLGGKAERTKDTDANASAGRAAAAASAAVASTPGGAQPAAASRGEDDRGVAANLPPPMIHDARVGGIIAQAQQQKPPSRFGIGFLAGVGLTLASVAVGAVIVVALSSDYFSDPSDDAAAASSSPALIHSAPPAPPAPTASTLIATEPTPSSQPPVPDVESEQPTSEEPTSEEPTSEEPTSAKPPAGAAPIPPAAKAPAWRHRPVRPTAPKRGPSYIPDDI